MSGGWWRSWHGAPGDPKWGAVAAVAGCKAAEVAALVWALLDHASQADPRGSTAGFNLRVYAFASGTELAVVQAILTELHADDIGVLRDGAFSNWEKRQPKREDSSADRVRKHRRNAAQRDVTHGNAPDTESDTDKNYSEAGASGGSAPPHPPASDKPIDLKAAVFGSGVPLLTTGGLTDRNARSMLGRWRQSHGDGAVLDALAAAQAESPSDIVAWMNRKLEARNGNGAGRGSGRGSGWLQA
jgi:hypothetical protein